MYKSGNGKFPVCCQRSISASISGVQSKSAFSGVAARSSCTGISIYGQRQLCFVQFRLSLLLIRKLLHATGMALLSQHTIEGSSHRNECVYACRFHNLCEIWYDYFKLSLRSHGITIRIYLTSYEGVHLQVRPFLIRLWGKKSGKE